MKNLTFFTVLVLFAAFGYAQTLDNAIENAAGEISGRLSEKSTVAVISFQSASARLTDYVIDELNGKLANIGKIMPVERRRINTIRSELNFNMSGEVSDESAQRIGQMFGAQYIITGSIEIIGKQYRIRFQAITVESAAIVYSFSQNVRSDTTLQTLLSGTEFLVDFTPAQRWGASGLNLLFGAGSFIIQHDTRGGGTTALIEGLGAVAAIAGYALYRAFDYSSYDQDYKGNPSILDSYFAYPFYIGLGTYAIGAVYGIIRAQIYHKPGAQVAVSPLDGLQLNLVSLDNKNAGVQIMYRLSF